MAGYKILTLFGLDIRVAHNPDDQEIEVPMKSAAASSSQITLQEHGDEEEKKKKKTSMKRNSDDVSSNKPKSVKRRRANIDDLPIPSLDGLPIFEKITRDGLRPAFLYRKWIEKSDVDRGLNRLFLSRSDGLMNFMTKEERDMVMSGEGLDISGLNSDGRVYMFHCTKWKTQSQPNLSKESWKQLVKDNRVEAGQMIEIWGDRRDGEKLWLIVNFRKEEAESESSGGSSSVTFSLGNSPTEEDGTKGWGRKKARGSNHFKAQNSYQGGCSLGSGLGFRDFPSIVMKFDR